MGKDLRKRLLEKQKKLQEQGSGDYKTMIIKDGTNRIRVANVGTDNAWDLEAVFFWLGDKVKGYLSPATFGEKCAVMKHYEKLKNSSDDDDQEMAKEMKPKQRWVVPAYRYKDEKGKEIDSEMGCKPLILVKDVYQPMLDVFLDEEGGDFTDPVNGFDFKIKKTGKGRTGTEYTAMKCNATKLPKEFRKEVDLEKMVRGIIPTYEESKAILKQFLNGSEADDDDDDAPKSKKSKSKGKDKKKKKKGKDL